MDNVGVQLVCTHPATNEALDTGEDFLHELVTQTLANASGYFYIIDELEGKWGGWERLLSFLDMRLNELKQYRLGNLEAHRKFYTRVVAYVQAATKHEINLDKFDFCG